MHSLFHSRDSNAPAIVEPIPTVFPPIKGAEITAVFTGKRIAGDFYDSIRVSPERVLFGLLDVAGRRDDNRGTLSCAQEIFRTAGAELFSRPDMNESEAMTELSLRINRGLIEFAKGVRSLPRLHRLLPRNFRHSLLHQCRTHTRPAPRRQWHHRTRIRTGLPLGLFSHATADAPTIGMEKGAALLLVSRGVVTCEGHATSPPKSSVWIVSAALPGAPPSSAQALCPSVLQAVTEFGARFPLCDDRTTLALLRRPLLGLADSIRVFHASVKNLAGPHAPSDVTRKE